VPDVVSIPQRRAAFRGIAAYIGDGATITRNMVRRDNARAEPIGDATIRAQLGWCLEARVARMIVTHCGSDIVAHDGMKLVLRQRRRPSRAKTRYTGHSQHRS
jgi:hypothetical protein